MKASEKHIDFKRQLFDECLSKQQTLIDDFKSRLEELKLARDLETQELSGASKKSLTKTEYDLVKDALDFADEELRILNYLGKNLNKSHESPELGAVVETDEGTFFISVSIEEFSADGKYYFGISTKSPLFKAMRDKHIGETFTYAGKKYMIKNIF